MSSDTIPRTDVTINLPDGVNVGHASLSSSLRDVTEIRVTHTAEREVEGTTLTVPEYVTLHVGEAHVTLAPAVWLAVVDGLSKVLDQVPSLTAVANA